MVYWVAVHYRLFRAYVLERSPGSGLVAILHRYLRSAVGWALVTSVLGQQGEHAPRLLEAGRGALR